MQTTSSPPIEPGVLPLFRFFIGLRLGLLTLTACSRWSANPPRVQRYPGLGLLETGFLMVYLSSPRLRRWLGPAYLPIAIMIASIGPIMEHFVTVVLRLRGGVSGAAANTDYWQVIALLFIPLIIIAWQYSFRQVLTFVAVTTMLDIVLSGPLAVRGSVPFITAFGIVFVRTILYVMVGYIVVRLMAAQRAQRAELAAANSQLAEANSQLAEANSQLAEANTQLKHYATTVERLTVSHERNRLARELHDTLAHTLSAVSVQLEATQALWDSDLDAARDSLGQARALTKNGLQEARRALQALRAQPLDDLGLALAVQQLAEQGAQRAGLTLDVDISVELEHLRPDVEQSIYRVAEEAITNVVRHANARTLSVRLGREAGQIVLAVVDDGLGFDPAAQRANGHYGLVGMQERAALCGGVLQVTSQPGQGAAVRLVIQNADKRG